ncbi:MAG: TrkH family potassium uptake protein [Planctomycetota bacterium]|nr:TrkH family potassium uptake protein [Planctomycetota bacterium]
MNLGQIARLLSGFILFFTLSLAIPLAVSLDEGELSQTSTSFVAAIVVGLVSSFLLWFSGRKSSKNMFRREGLAMVGIAWFLAAALAAIPFVWSGAIPSFVDAYFESVSGLTTTGATVLGTANTAIEAQPPSILLWRAMLQWMGGIGIVLVFIVLLPGVGVTGSRLLSSEQVGMNDDAVRPRMARRARSLLALYVTLTAAAAFAYWAVGLSGFDAVCHSLTTLATGGFSTKDVSIGGYQNLGVEMVAVVFMFLAGCNFLLVLRVLTHRGRASQSSVLPHSEFRVYVGILVLVSLGVAFSLWSWGEKLPDNTLGTVRDYNEFGQCLRDSVFQTVSLLTGTGYANADFQSWPKSALFLLLFCMLVGGCTGSTSGGFKVLRLIVCVKLAGYVLRHFVRPRTVEKLRVGSGVVPDQAITAVVGLLALWIAMVLVGTVALSLDPRLDLVSAFVGSVSMMGCVGPAFGQAVSSGQGAFETVGSIDIGPYSGYGELHPLNKLFMCLQMVLGRLEILAPLALLTPGFWKR